MVMIASSQVGDVYQSQYFDLSQSIIICCYFQLSCCRSNGSILHNLILASQRPATGYTLNNVNSPVLYKLIHYFMENPINGSTVLKFPVEEDVSGFSRTRQL